MKVIFIKEHTDENGVETRPGSVVEMDDVKARELIQKGIVRERREPRSPEETKEEQEYESGKKPRDYPKKEET